MFQQALSEQGIKHVRSSAYHPDSRGALERYPQMLKNMMWKEVLQESLGFSLNELVFAHHAQGPWSLVREPWSSDIDIRKNLLQYFMDFKTRLSDTQELARENLKVA